MIRSILAAALATMAFAAHAADLQVHPQHPVARVAKRCAYVVVEVVNYGGEDFKVSAVGGPNPYSSKVTILAKLQGNRLCIPPEFFRADEVNICLGRGPTNARLIRGRWMDKARANLAHGDIVNPGEPMKWRGYQPSRRGRPMMLRRPRRFI